MIARAVALRARLSPTRPRPSSAPTTRPRCTRRSWTRASTTSTCRGATAATSSTCRPTCASCRRSPAAACRPRGASGLTMNHALMVGVVVARRRRRTRSSRGGDFRCALGRGAGRATRDAGRTAAGRSTARSRSRRASPYSTFYMGQAMLPAPAGASAEVPAAAAVRRSAQRVGDARRLGRHARSEGLGLAQHPLRAQRIPASWGFEGNMIDVDVAGGTPGLAPARQPDVLGPGDVSIFTLSLAAVTVGGGLQRARRVRAADARTQDAAAAVQPAHPGPRVPALVRPRADAHRHRRGGAARHRASATWSSAGATSRTGSPYTYGDDMLLAGIAREADDHVLGRGRRTTSGRPSARRSLATASASRASSATWRSPPRTATRSCATCSTARSRAQALGEPQRIVGR